jgi:hypothetical protein
MNTLTHKSWLYFTDHCSSTPFYFLGWGEPEPTWYVCQCFPTVPHLDDRWWYVWSSQWNDNWQGTRSTRRKPSPVPRHLIWVLTWAVAERSQRIIAWAEARPYRSLLHTHIHTHTHTHTHTTSVRNHGLHQSSGKGIQIWALSFLCHNPSETETPDWFADSLSRSRNRSYFTTDGESVCLPSMPTTRFYFFLSFAGKLLCSSSWGALSDEREGLQFVVQSVSGQSHGLLITIH